MNENLLNRLAALMSGEVEDAEKGRLLEELARDSEGLELLSVLDQPEVEGPIEIEEFPFPVMSSIRLGVHQGCFKTLSLEGATLEDSLEGASSAVSRVAGASFPRCFKGSLDFKFAISQFSGEIQVKPDSARPESIELKIQMEKEGDLPGYVELWENGILLEACPASTVSKESFNGIPNGSVCAIKPSGAPFGLGFRVRPVPFRIQDWVSVCLTSSALGDFATAKSVLQERVQPLVSEWTRFRNTLGFFDIFKSLFSARKGMLVPAPVTRSIVDDTPTRRGVCEHLWNGIIQLWPEAKGVSKPWETPGAADADSIETGWPPEVQDLVGAIGALYRDPSIEVKATAESRDPELRRGWAACSGWRAVLNFDYKRAREEFGAVEPDENDSFSLRAGLAFADHLMRLQRDPAVSDDCMATSDRVLSEVFQSLLGSSLEREDGMDR